MENKKIISINGPVILAKGEADFAMHDMVFVGNKKLLGEVIKLEKDIATIQVYENTSGLKIDELVISSYNQLSVTLAPGLLGNIFDGIQRPLKEIKEISGDFIERGITVDKISTKKKWLFKPLINVSEKLILPSLNFKET